MTKDCSPSACGSNDAHFHPLIATIGKGDLSSSFFFQIKIAGLVVECLSAISLPRSIISQRGKKTWTHLTFRKKRGVFMCF